ncbi:hypothetical protein NDU88_005506 [Pleurodeles waltl]|uniref:Uncharacterized protein n=1 Tax=Pleurodeles waltl TaxID=8319 RepID=A0AAV7WX87_PLEWA|nr:hypothetical protein NDU88_005506 [Pleurodeles waltl]
MVVGHGGSKTKSSSRLHDLYTGWMHKRSNHRAPLTPWPPPLTWDPSELHRQCQSTALPAGSSSRCPQFPDSTAAPAPQAFVFSPAATANAEAAILFPIIYPGTSIILAQRCFRGGRVARSRVAPDDGGPQGRVPAGRKRSDGVWGAWLAAEEAASVTRSSGATIGAQTTLSPRRAHWSVYDPLGSSPVDPRHRVRPCSWRLCPRESIFGQV